MSTALVHVYFTLKVDTPEVFRVEFNQLMSVMRITIAKKYRKGVRNIMWLLPSCSFKSTVKYARLYSHHPSLVMIFPGTYLPWSGT